MLNSKANNKNINLQNTLLCDMVKVIIKTYHKGECKLTVDYREELSTKLLFILSQKFQIDVDEARLVLDEAMSEYDIGKVCTALVATDIDERLKMYIASKKFEGVANSTLKEYYREISNFGRHIIKPVNSVTTMDIRRYLSLYHDKIKGLTMNTKISRMKTFFTWLHSEGYIDNNPALKLKQVKTEQRVRQPITEEDLEMVINSCETLREKAILDFTYSTGCRVSEVVSVSKGDINWNERSLYVVGKGDKQRKVYFSARAKISILKYLESRKDDGEALFVSSKKPYSRLGVASIQREVKRVGKRTPNKTHVFPHRIRHTMATNSINSGVSLTALQNLLGHESPNTTLLYAKTSDIFVKQEYLKL